MKILTLIIKQKYFDQIISGEKTDEYRETTLRTEKKYIQMDEDGYVLKLREDGLAETDWTGLSKPLPKQYDAIRFYVGYRMDRDSALVKVNSVEVSWVLWHSDDDGKDHPLIYGLSDEQVAAGETFFIPLVLRYNLGEIIEKNVKGQS